MYEVIDISAQEIKALLNTAEDHFNDFKSKQIAPNKLQETFVAFANADGGNIYIGIEDAASGRERISGFNEPEEANAIISTLLENTNPAVENVEVEYLRTPSNGLILHVDIPKSPKVHYTASGDCFIRANAQKLKIKGERITQLSYSKGAEPYEKKAVDIVEVEDILESEYYSDYLRRIGTTQSPRVFLKKQRLLTKKDGEFVPNVGCVLLFDEEPQGCLDTRCAVKVYRLRTTEAEYKREQLQEDPVTIEGPLEVVILNTIAKVKEYVDGASFKDGENLVKLSYPAEALKEILVNAVIHRDYSQKDDVHVKVYDNRIEVQSPGRLPGYMTINNLYEERFSRNPNLVRLLHKLPNPVNHDIGEGLDTAKNELRKAGLVAPVFEERGNNFVVIVKHQTIASIEDVIINYFKENPTGQLTNKLVRQLSGEDDLQKVKKALQKLREEGVIKPLDPNANPFKFKYIKA
ncbi:TPA: RNA-binding domain-containing protein [Escherichia coli]|uniref:RNA-binding domain-containing protein n=1 Tax=Escherichia coli TaxID=562 RepID=UPI000450E0A2|nr:RNA-binding domain-containing protein [Escherichia coli]EEZ0870461.1 transcriptional regulator [Escherichia coli]EFH9141958.1 transcriptional regulator [Escherichia coli]EFN7895046.1 transcriptional regulator [Escherichia coli]EFO3959883.1 transcriptional regulator [Escherichia coli]EFT2751764.1 transcriptional regulator [Escherichia coli]